MSWLRPKQVSHKIIRNLLPQYTHILTFIYLIIIFSPINLSIIALPLCSCPHGASELIRQTFRKLGLSLAVDGSEDAELSIRDLLGIVVGDWRLADGQVNEQQVDNPVKIDELPESINPRDN